MTLLPIRFFHPPTPRDPPGEHHRLRAYQAINAFVIIHVFETRVEIGRGVAYKCERLRSRRGCPKLWDRCEIRGEECDCDETTRKIYRQPFNWFACYAMRHASGGSAGCLFDSFEEAKLWLREQLDEEYANYPV